MLDSGATPSMGTVQAATAGGSGQGPEIAAGACSLSGRTRVEVLANRKPACPASTVPTHVPCAPLLRLVADGTGSPATKVSPPTTVPVSAGTTGEFVVPLSMTAVITPCPNWPFAWNAEAPMSALLKV